MEKEETIFPSKLHIDMILIFLIITFSLELEI